MAVVPLPWTGLKNRNRVSTQQCILLLLEKTNFSMAAFQAKYFYEMFICKI